jgi:AcrR family transcriptional regulator
METSLHRQLKALYCTEVSSQEVRVDGFRIDAVDRGRLIEIQQGSLGALRDKVRKLLGKHDVTVVKPLAARKLLIRRKRLGGAVLSTRYSPRRETVADLFADLVHFVGVFPHPRLTLEVVLTLQEEHRVPARKRRWRGPDFKVLDRMLVGIEGRMTLKDSRDLASLLPAGLADVFSTAEIAREAAMSRWLAQKMAYCLRKTGAIAIAGKQGNSWLYQRTDT